jgi:hypothetical protein
MVGLNEAAKDNVERERAARDKAANEISEGYVNDSRETEEQAPDEVASPTSWNPMDPVEEALPAVDAEEAEENAIAEPKTEDLTDVEMFDTPPVKPVVERSTKWRTWTAGTYTCHAKFVKAIGSKVTLEKEDGSQIEIPMDKLSEDDQDFIRLRQWK